MCARDPDLHIYNIRPLFFVATLALTKRLKLKNLRNRHEITDWELVAGTVHLSSISASLNSAGASLTVYEGQDPWHTQYNSSWLFKYPDLDVL
jgi:hypothetical protein